MKDGKEELEDIESEIRARALAWLDESMTRYDLRLADRIAEAREREREAAEARQLNECMVVREEEADKWRKRTGDAARMRAALESIAGYCKGCEAEYCDVCSVTLTAKQMQKALAALAAPARNCDLFADYASALEYWQTHEECAEVNGCFDVWLMARAEGGKA